jgi:uncharacterized membrane protein
LRRLSWWGNAVTSDSLQGVPLIVTMLPIHAVEEFFKKLADAVALGVEAGAVLIIAYGALEASYQTVVAISHGLARSGRRKQVLVQFGVWLLLGLEFELAADVVRTVIAPTWTQIGQLAAIGLIRTFLNHFLEEDLERYEASAPIEPTKQEFEKAA